MSWNWPARIGCRSLSIIASVFLGIGIAAAGIVAGAIAAVTGFGIGSLVTPVLAVETGTKLAVAAVSIPHLVATAQRYWMLRAHVDRRVLLIFGIPSAVGGLAGALVHVRVSSRALAIVFGILVALAGVSELTGWMKRVRWGRRSGWMAGAVSGALGGMVGNQGGIRTAALLGFHVPKDAFVATATAIALFVDGARLPVYLVSEWNGLVVLWPLVAIATAAVMIGTALGTRVLGRLPQETFRRVVALLLIVLGVYMAIAGRG